MLISPDATIAPAWLVLPMAGLAVVATLVHLSMLNDPEASAGVPLSRRRIRNATGAVTLITIMVLAYAFGVVTLSEPRAFAMAWSASMGLLGLVVLLACCDAMNSLRLHRRDVRRLRSARRASLEDLAVKLRRASDPLPSTDRGDHAE